MDATEFDPATHRRRLQRREGRDDERFLTASCFKRLSFLNADRSRRWLVEAIDLARTTHGFDLWAWVIMPEHFHLIIDPVGVTRTVGPILSTIKQSVAKRALIWVRREAPEFLGRMADVPPDGRTVHRFWQRGAGFDRNLWSSRHIHEKINYVHKNPVTRGLCAAPQDWAWSSAREWAKRGAGPLSLDLDRVPRIVKSS